MNGKLLLLILLLKNSLSLAPRLEKMAARPTATSAKRNRVLQQPGFPAFGPNLRDTDKISPSTPKESCRTRQSKNNSSRCSIFGNKGKIDSPSDSDEFGEEVIYSHESPKMDEIININSILAVIKNQ